MTRTPEAGPPVDGVRIAVVGTCAWGLAFVAALVAHTTLSDSGRGWWITTAGVGVLLGLIGIAFLRRFERDIVAR